jgi:hypothetical protein
MKRLQFLFSLAVCLNALVSFARSENPIWAKEAVSLSACTNIRSTPKLIPSPDGKLRVEVRCHNAKNDNDPIPFLSITLPRGRLQSINLREGARELLWAPDSSAFFVNGGESAYSGFWISVYIIKSDSIAKVDLVHDAQSDMVASFPPCRASNRDESLCRKITEKPEYNMSGVTWSGGGSAIIVVAEVPCSSLYGGIMCQVLGYKLDAATGRIIQRMNPSELKEKWQSEMAWDLRIPAPPKYGPH